MNNNVDKKTFAFLQELIRDRSWISLSEDKVYLIDSRLLPLARKHEFASIEELVEAVKSGEYNNIITEIIEAITTNETSFFRDIKPFDIFKNNIIPHLVKNNSEKNLKIWCAACSTGQEPYSLAMTIKEESAKLPGFKTEIIATDINETVIKKAKDGIYSQFEIQRGLPITMLMKYFKQEESYGERWALNNNVKDMVKFSTLNLQDTYSRLGKFDVIFCRNVLIYFDADVKIKILEKLAGQLKPHGLLFLGSAETVSGFTNKFTIFENFHGIYQLQTL